MFLDSFPEDIGNLARQLVRFLRNTRPEFTTTVRLGWRSINFRHPRAKLVCGVFPTGDHVRLLFEHGRFLSAEHGLLEGNGKQVRYVRLEPGSAVPETAIALMLAEAIARRS